jgi:hypothetical protein
MKLDLDNDNVKEIDVTAQEIRDYIDGIDGDMLSTEKLDGYFDEAQGAVFTGEKDTYYIVFRVTK